MPSLVIGLLAGVITGWLLQNVAHVDSITSIWVSAVFSTIVAIVLRLLLKTVSFSGD
jgi:fructose-specific phosphotransferase system IIC component